MAVESRHQPQLAGIPYDQLRYAPQFSNPWVTSAPVSGQVYASAHPATTLDNSSQLQQQQSRPNLTLPPYQGLPITSTSLPQNPNLQTASYGASPALQAPQGYGQFPTSTSAGYQTAPAPGYTIELPPRSANGFAYPQEPARRPSHPFSGTSQQQRNSFSEAVDASRNIISLSQSDITPTPRNMYGADQQRSASPDSYGFPQTHSNHSSISSASGFHSNYGSSVGDYSLTDYSSASESVDMNHRTLPPPSTLGNSIPPAPSSMMGQFSSKVSTSSQKKHKCKVCDKRFTRPSSLQTHMYSHTGEKPFACDVEGCGRHFSVVSNLRRHKKVHKNDASSVTTNED
ncbi:C2H2 finger domain-containing protein FlbC [Microthyrium microscopicum]|uniref:C2H2 finger domain-containing protein FlbC n=1 Tax=Microthyrium microscopicum TaxID=703497 RepID=A0A6A6UR98_9PEZI|nr:C2H2 finger domain-containing protein FlbC [Microthyrium microscopicum]